MNIDKCMRKFCHGCRNYEKCFPTKKKRKKERNNEIQNKQY
nr:MAG TPA: hypothetical protein [Caudoviricetes sp.]